MSPRPDPTTSAVAPAGDPISAQAAQAADRASSRNHPSPLDIATSVSDPSASRRVGPGSVIGMLGGGQLGRMFAIAAAQLGYRVVVLGDSPDCPAATVAEATLAGSLTDPRLLDELAARCDVVTLEFENIPVASVERLAGSVNVFPAAEVLRVAQDRGIEKQTLSRAGLPVTPFQLVHDRADVEQAVQRLGLPLVLKTTRDGYDGKGQWKIGSAEELSAWLAGGDTAASDRFERPLIAEAWVEHQCEVSVIIARSVVTGGDPTDTGAGQRVACYPVFENRHRNHILDVTLCPAAIDPETARRATEMATTAAAALGLIGLICIEFFVDSRGELMINEIAPRPHNSGHLTIEACQTSQFEQQLRAVCGLPLGSTELTVPAAAMVNLMGELWSDGEPDWDAILALPATHLHLYDKRAAKPGRKMGHITLTGDPAELPARIERIRQILS